MIAVADASKVSRATVWAVLGGRRAATTDVLAKLAAALGVDPGDLVRAPRKKKSGNKDKGDNKDKADKAPQEPRARRGSPRA